MTPGTKDGALDAIAMKVQNAERLSCEDGVQLLKSDDLESIGALANIVRERKNGNKGFFIRNQHFDPTNLCEYNCRFCSWNRNPDRLQAV